MAIDKNKRHDPNKEYEKLDNPPSVFNPTPNYQENSKTNYGLIALGIIIGAGLVFLLIYFFLNKPEPPESPIPEPTPAPTVDSALILRNQLLQEIKKDSTVAMRSAMNFFTANENKNESLMANTLSDQIYQYPVLKFSNKEELVNEIKKYWYLVTNEKNTVQQNTIQYFSKKKDPSLQYSYITFDIHYTADTKQGPLDLNFAVKMEMDEYQKVIAYSTERL